MTATSYPRSFNRPNLQNIDEVQAYSPDAFLAQALDAHQTTAILAHSPAAERGEFQLQINSHLAAYNRAFDSPDGKHSPATSDTSLTSASTAPSEPMTRSNTNDVLCFGIDMMRMNSMSHPEQYESEFAKVTGVDDATLFSLHDTNAYHDLSYSVDCFPYGSEMKHSLSQDSNTSSPSVVQSHFVPTRAQELRRLEPKQSHDAALIKQSESPEVKLVERTLEDGTKVMKAEISRSARHQPPRKTTFCPHCNDQPQGFHGEHELNRHIDRQHKSVRKVWVCKDISSNGFLSGCKACRNDKTYGANYNAAAHLRRAHFNPCKNKRGGRGKKSEGRGGMGGGNKPSMDELKHWMYAMYEIIIDGKVVEMRPVPPEGQEDIYAAQVMPVPADMSYDINMTADDYCDFDYSPPAEQMGYDMAAGMSQSYSMMAPPMHTMQVPAQHYGHVSVNYMQMQTQPIYINWVLSWDEVTTDDEMRIRS